MAIAQGYSGGKDATAANLLEACCFWDRARGGTIHEYLPRLRWERAAGACVRGMGPVPVWHLMLDGREIGWTQCKKANLPAIEPGMDRNILNYLPVGCEWMD